MKHSKTFQYLCAVFWVLGFLAGCDSSPESPSLPPDGTPRGKREFRREFRIEAEKPALEVKLTGVSMGTPDTDAVSAVIQNARAMGVFSQDVEVCRPVEGGICSCFELPDPESRGYFAAELRVVPTSHVESNYSVRSVDFCPQPGGFSGT